MPDRCLRLTELEEIALTIRRLSSVIFLAGEAVMSGGTDWSERVEDVTSLAAETLDELGNRLLDEKKSIAESGGV